MCWLGATFNQQEEVAVNKWKEEVLAEQPPPRNGDSPFSFNLDHPASPEPSVPTKWSKQVTHPVLSSPMPGSSQLMATTTSPVNLTKPVQGDENDDGKIMSTQAMEQESPLLTLSVSALADILETPKPPATNDSEIQDIGSNSEQVGPSKSFAPEQDASLPKKEKLE